MNDIVRKEESGHSCELKKEDCKFPHGEGKKHYEILPAMEAADDENGVEITLEVPGCSNENVKIEVEDGVLNIWGASCLTHCGMEVVYKRSFRLSDAVDVPGITACTKDGLLKICLPKAEKARVHLIPVK